MSRHMTRGRSASRHAILTLKIFTYALLLTVMLTAVFLVTVPDTNCAQGPGVQLAYEENFDDVKAVQQAWELDEPFWWVEVPESGNGILVGQTGGGWARYRQAWWCDGKFTFTFAVRFFYGILLANFHVKGLERYIIRLATSDGKMYIELLKRLGRPPTYETSLQAKSWDYRGGWFRVDILTEDGRIRVYVYDEKTLSYDPTRVAVSPLIYYTDPNPLPAGTVGLQTSTALDVLTRVEVDYVRIIGSVCPCTTQTATTTIRERMTTTISGETTRTATTTTTERTAATTTEEIVPRIFYVYVPVAMAVAGVLGAAAVYYTLPGIGAPPVPDLASLSRRFIEIENLAKARPPSLLSSTADVEKILDSTKRGASKLNDIMKKLKAAKDEEGVVDTLVEFVEQIRNSSDDVGSFSEFLAQKVAEATELKSHWFNILTGNLVEIRHALDSATTMIRQYASGAMLFEGLARNYALLASAARKVESAFTLRDTNEMNAAITKLREAKSQLDIALSGVSRGLADWYGRLSWQKYLRAGVSLGK